MIPQYKIQTSACAAVIPCLDEEGTIAEVVRGVRRHLPTVFVIDDGSRDGTARAAAGESAIVIRHKAPRGKGASLREGWEAARQAGFAWVLMLDGDGQHAPRDIPKFLARAEATGAALVVGNRMEMAQQIPWLRRAVNRWMSRRLSCIAGRALPDTQCGFRLARLEVLCRLALNSRHYEIESEQLLAFLAAGEQVEFVPVSVIYRAERSKINPWRDTVRWFRWLRRWKSGKRKAESENRE